MEKRDLLGYLKRMSAIDAMLENQPFAEVISHLEELVYSSKYKIAVVGEFSTGKSTFINALLGEELLYKANKESTGVITTIQYDPIAHVEVLKKNGIQIDKFNLDSEEARTKLNEYLDIQNKREIENVNIFYPMEGLDNDIIFFDTPGIEKLSEAQMYLTKSVLEQANAIIFLIKKSGFTPQALQVITGKHEIIGKLPVKDIFLVMTHIGEVYSEKTEEAAEYKIVELVRKVKSELLENGIEDMKIYPVDSLEYLWGCNNELYTKEKESRNILLNGEVLEQEIYRERSRFEQLKTDLFHFLQADNRNINVIKDIKNKINLLLDSMEEQFLSDDAKNSDKIDVLRMEIEQKITHASQNKRKCINRSIRNLQEHIVVIKDAVRTDNGQVMKIDRSVLELINRTFCSLSDLNHKNYEKCVNIVVKDTEEFALKTENNVNEHIKVLFKNYLEKIINSDFEQMFHKKVNIVIEASYAEFKVEFDNVKDALLFGDEELQKLEILKNAEMSNLRKLEKEYAVFHVKDVTAASNKYNLQKKNLDEWYKCELQKLGSRPKAVQKYKTVTKTEGILFWKKTITKKVPNGMDRTASLEWDKKQSLLQKEYEARLEELEKAADNVDKWIKKKREYENRIQEKKNLIRRMDEKISLQKELIQNEKVKYTEAYISRKKEEITSCCEQIKRNMLNQLINQIEQYLYDVQKDIEQFIKSEMSRSIEEYEKELREKNNRLCETIRMSEDTCQSIIQQIAKLREEINYEPAV